MDKWIELVKAKMSELTITQEILAHRLGMSQGGIGHWLTKRRRPSIEDMNRVLDALGMDYLEVALVIREPLDSPDDVGALLKKYNPYFRYPVSDWRETAKLHDGEVAVYSGAHFELSDYHAQGAAFWLKVEGDAMTAPIGMSIAEDMMILVDPDIEALPGMLVIARWADNAEAIFRKLIEAGGQRYLVPLNPTYPKDVFTDECQIIGVVVQATAKF